MGKDTVVTASIALTISYNNHGGIFPSVAGSPVCPQLVLTCLFKLLVEQPHHHLHQHPHISSTQRQV